jgi:hypothetical protein
LHSTWKEIERAQNRGCQSLNYKERTLPTIHREEILVGGLTLLSSFRIAIVVFGTKGVRKSMVATIFMIEI